MGIEGEERWGGNADIFVEYIVLKYLLVREKDCEC